MRDLEDMVAIVVGGADNIGRATAEMLAARGAAVAIGYRSNAAGATAGCDAIRAAGGKAIAIQVEHSQEPQVEAMVAQTLAAFGKINILINNAAKVDPEFVRRDRDIAQMDTQLWDEAMASNLRGPMLTCKHTIPHMIAAGYGSIVNTGSGVVFRGDTVRNAYSASKIGLHSMTMDIATSYGKDNVRCNLISPGLIMTQSVRDGVDEAAIATLANQNLVPFIGEPNDIAEVSCFLASPASRYITGQIIAVDGGLHVHQCVIGQI